MKCVVLVLVLCFAQALGRYVPFLVAAPSKLPRQDLIGGWIQSTEWLPIEINIPDVISYIGNGLSSGFMNISDSFGNWLQQVPWFNRVITQMQTRPRPSYKHNYKYLVFMPVKDGEGINVNEYPMSDFVPVYP